MDLKGISWVGNLYERFEAMCLEVEETMFQDTVKYVENQVETVGSSLKRFYSDIMQDLLPPSSVDAAKGKDSNLTLDFYGDVGIFMNPKIGKINDIKKVTEDRIKTSNCHSDCAPSSQCVRNKSDLRTRKSSKRGNSTLNEKLESGDVNISSFCEPSNENHRGNPQKNSNEISKIDTSSGKDLNRASSVNENHSSFHQETVSDFIEESRSETEIVSEQSDEVSEADSSFISELEIIQQVEKPKLEESCIVVNRDDFHFVPCHTGNSKKKIRDVFSSTRKHEYEQLAMWPIVKDSDLEEDEKRFSAVDEAEWELL